MESMAAIRSEVARSDLAALLDYVIGASHDGTISRLHNTLRISQKTVAWLDVIEFAIHRLGHRSWRYREGRRDVWVLESSIRLPELKSVTTSFIRGFFDAEGGTPQAIDARFYIQLVQKNGPLLADIRRGLVARGIRCGVLHNPSVRVDPNYWRFFVRASSWSDFATTIGSWHPRKRAIFDRRFKLRPGR